MVTDMLLGNLSSSLNELLFLLLKVTHEKNYDKNVSFIAFFFEKCLTSLDVQQPVDKMPSCDPEFMNLKSIN